MKLHNLVHKKIQLIDLLNGWNPLHWCYKNKETFTLFKLLYLSLFFANQDIQLKKWNIMQIFVPCHNVKQCKNIVELTHFYYREHKEWSVCPENITSYSKTFKQRFKSKAFLKVYHQMKKWIAYQMFNATYTLL